MKSQILIKANNFIKNRVIETFGLLLALTSVFLLLSIASYSPDDPNFIYSPGDSDIKNITGFYGSVISDFLLQSLGLTSFLVSFTILNWGLKIISEKKINHFANKIFYTLLYIIFGTLVLNIAFNHSFWLISNGNGGFVGRILKENIYYFTTLIENIYIVNFLIILTITFFILAL